MSELAVERSRLRRVQDGARAVSRIVRKALDRSRPALRPLRWLALAVYRIGFWVTFISVMGIAVNEAGHDHERSTQAAEDYARAFKTFAGLCVEYLGHASRLIRAMVDLLPSALAIPVTALLLSFVVYGAAKAYRALGA